MTISKEDFNFMVESITSDLIQMLMQKNKLSFREAFDAVYDSNTYLALCDEKSKLYYQSSGYVYSYLESEIYGK